MSIHLAMSRVRPEPGQSGSGLRRRVAVSAVAAMAAGSLVLAGSVTAFASISTGLELDGNVLDDGAALPSAPDWGPWTTGNTTNSIFTLDSATGKGVKRSPLPTGFFDAGFARDFTPGSTSDGTTFTQGAKDTLNISTGWSCVGANNVTDKGDIQNAYSAVYSDTSFSPPHLVLYFGMEKNTANGDNNMGVWFLQDGSVQCAPNGKGAGNDFQGNHVDGDILVVAAFLNGGGNPQVSAYQWKGDGATGALSTTPVASGTTCTAIATICAITNSGASVTTPWLTVNGKVQGTSLGTDQFYEGGVDLTANNLDHKANGDPICINKFLFNTRSSQSLTASLYDFAEGSVSTCATPELTTELHQQAGATQDPSTDPSLKPPAETVTLPATVYDTSSISGGLGTTTGTVTYSLWTDDKCTAASTDPTFSGGGNTAEVTIGAGGVIPASPSLVFTAAQNYYWQAHYAPGAGSRNKAVDSACTSEPLKVIKPKPSIATTPSATIQVGGDPARTINDVANISGGYFPSGGIAVGTVTFKLYGPFTSTPTSTSCIDSGTGANLLATYTNNAARVTDTTAKATSDSFTPTTVGTYQWVAKYNGNAQNEGAPLDSNGNIIFTLCGDTTEQVVVTPVTPPVSTKMKLSDTAKVASLPGAGAPKGDVTFKLYNSADCQSGLVSGTTQTVTIDASGVASSNAYAVNSGTYSWLVTFTPDPSAATGNPNYTSATTVCTPAQSDESATFSYAGTSPTS